MTKGEKKWRHKDKKKAEQPQWKNAAEMTVGLTKSYEGLLGMRIVEYIGARLNEYNFSPGNEGDNERAEVSEALQSCANNFEKLSSATVNRFRELAAKISGAAAAPKPDVEEELLGGSFKEYAEVQDEKLTTINEGDN
jgi:hypothetical protein